MNNEVISRVVPPPPRWLRPLGWIALLGFVAAQAIGFLISAPDRDMGNLQKIMYVHVPSAWVAMLGFFVVFVLSIAFLVTRREDHDRRAAATAEVSVLFTALTLVLGSIWGRPTWGIWWTWDPRLTSTAIMLLIYVGYLALRAFTEDEDRRARWSAAVGILGFLNVPIVYFSVKWWRTLHQVQTIDAAGAIDSAYALALLLNSIAFLLVFVWLVALRAHVARLERLRESWIEDEALVRTGSEAHV
ncbi:MAG TPA: cytochrome c biogenesis protein CcsA [Longimicrobiales bacterium]|nr:cytochrome c biogenesis protein CcsA [Longimicrobiales bacterium]